MGVSPWVLADRQGCLVPPAVRNGKGEPAATTGISLAQNRAVPLVPPFVSGERTLSVHPTARFTRADDEPRTVHPSKPPVRGTAVGDCTCCRLDNPVGRGLPWAYRESRVGPTRARVSGAVPDERDTVPAGRGASD